MATILVHHSGAPQRPCLAPTLLVHNRPKCGPDRHTELWAAWLQRCLARRHVLAQRNGAAGVQARGAEQQHARGRFCQLPTNLRMHGKGALLATVIRASLPLCACWCCTPAEHLLQSECISASSLVPAPAADPPCALTAKGAPTPSTGTTNFWSRWGTICLGSAEVATTLWSHSTAAAARKKRCTCGSGAADVSMMSTCSAHSVKQSWSDGGLDGIW